MKCVLLLLLICSLYEIQGTSLTPEQYKDTEGDRAYNPETDRKLENDSPLNLLSSDPRPQTDDKMENEPALSLLSSDPLRSRNPQVGQLKNDAPLGLLSSVPRRSRIGEASVQLATNDAAARAQKYMKYAWCAKPYIYQGKSYSKCLKWHRSWWYGGDYWWCATHGNYDEHPNWNKCHDENTPKTHWQTWSLSWQYSEPVDDGGWEPWGGE